MTDGVEHFSAILNGIASSFDFQWLFVLLLNFGGTVCYFPLVSIACLLESVTDKPKVLHLLKLSLISFGYNSLYPTTDQEGFSFF